MKDEFVPYHQCPVFSIWTDDRFITEGHMVIRYDDTIEEIKKNFIELLVGICEENNLTFPQTVKVLKENLERNGLHIPPINLK